MITLQQESVHKARLNPFAFPSDTDFRFVLLIATVLETSLFIYFVLYAASPMNTGGPEEGRVWVTIGVVLLFVVAGVIFLVTPAWKIWHGGWELLQDQDLQEVEAYLADLCREAELSSLPMFMCNMLRKGTNAIAFGRPGRYYVALPGALIKLFYSNVDTHKLMFRAIVLHELAHLRNADVSKTYFANAIWWAFVMTALVPYTVVLFAYYSDIPLQLSVVVRILVLTALVYLIRSAVLRTREVYADVRASVWDGREGLLRQVLATQQSSRSFWQRLFDFHPHPEERRRAIDDTTKLFGLSFWDACGTGLAIGIGLPNIIFVLILPNVTFLFVIGIGAIFVAGLIFAPLIVGIVGLGMWRATFASLVQGRTLPSVGRLSLGLGLGVLLGEGLMFFGKTGLILANTKLVPFINIYSFDIPWVILFTGSLYFFLRWIVEGASVWLEVGATISSPRFVYWGGFLITSILLSLLLILLFNLQFLGDYKNITDISSLIAVLYFIAFTSYIQPLTILIFISLWAYPLAAWFWREQIATSTGSSWAFLDASQELALPRQAPLRPGFTLLVGVVGGLAFWVLLLLVTIEVRLAVPRAIRMTDQFATTSFYVIVVLAMLMQGIVAAFVAARVQRLGSQHGLFAAFVAGCVMTIGILGGNVLSGGVDNGLLIWTAFSTVTTGGAFVSLLFAPFVAMLTRWNRRLFQTKAKEDMPGSLLDKPTSSTISGSPSNGAIPSYDTHSISQQFYDSPPQPDNPYDVPQQRFYDPPSQARNPYNSLQHHLIGPSFEQHVPSIVSSPPTNGTRRRVILITSGVLLMLVLASIGSSITLAQLVGHTTTTVVPPTPSLTPLLGPSGSPIVPSATAIITDVQTASAIDSNTNAPTKVATTFTRNETVYVTFTVNSGGQKGNVEAKVYDNNVLIAKNIYTDVSDQSQYELEVHLNSVKIAVPSKMAIELYWCIQSDCRDEQLEAVTTFTITSATQQ